MSELKDGYLSLGWESRAKKAEAELARYKAALSAAILELEERATGRHGILDRINFILAPGPAPDSDNRPDSNDGADDPAIER